MLWNPLHPAPCRVHLTQEHKPALTITHRHRTEVVEEGPGAGTFFRSEHPPQPLGLLPPGATVRGDLNENIRFRQIK